jgi:cytochrome c5
MRTGRLAGIAIAAIALAGCPSKPKPSPPSAADAGAPTQKVSPPEPAADSAHGKEIVGAFQCNRCHDGAGQPPPPANKDCVRCHADIVAGRFDAPAATIARWKPRVKDLTASPSLEAVGKRFSRSWVTRYLLQPTDLRPHLHPSMPRLTISPADARDVAAYLVPDPDPPGMGAEKEPAELAGADLGEGRRLLETKGCGSCHVFSGVAALPSTAPPAMDAKQFAQGHALAPDLRFARDRMSAAKMLAWLADPKEIKADTTMPKIALTPVEAKDVAAYVLTVELAAPQPKPRPARLPLLERKVTFKEVDEKVFHRTCWHCHSEPDYAIGDGGPGNSGGFGFKPRGLNLSDYNGIAAGFLDDKGERSSVFARDADGVPRLVKALLARHDEESGAETGDVRGMPLGYEALAIEDIQLVDTWIAQGRPR